MTERKLRSIDDIIHDLNDIADDPDSGPDKFRALKMLHGTLSANSQVLHQPLVKSERMERWMRLMRPAGKEEVDEAYFRSFGMRAKHKVPLRAQADQLPPETLYKISKVKTVKQFHRMCPELKKGGHPGYRKGAGELEKIEYFQKRATEYFIDKMNLAEPISGYSEHRAEPVEAAKSEIPAGEAPNGPVG